MPKMLSLKQASTETGLSYYCLRNLCLNGEIAHIRSGNKYMINADRLEEYLDGMGNEEEKSYDKKE